MSKNDITLNLRYKEALAVKHALNLKVSTCEDELAVKLVNELHEQIMQFRKDKNIGKLSQSTLWRKDKNYWNKVCVY